MKLVEKVVDAKNECWAFGRNIFDNGMIIPWSRLTASYVPTDPCIWDKNIKQWRVKRLGGRARLES